jgi:pyrophosphatase PpaX
VRIRGIIFDLDGTLGNTLPVCYEAFRRVFQRRLGRLYSDAEIHAMFGPSEEGILEALIPSDPDGALNEYLREYQAAHRAFQEPFEGIPEALDLLESRGVKIAIVTGKGSNSAAISLEELRLSHYFKIVEAGSASGAAKPDAMRRVLSAWSLSPSEVVGVGDAASDIGAAREVGITCIAAAWAPTVRKEVLASLAPDHLFDSVSLFNSWLENQTINMQSP